MTGLFRFRLSQHSALWIVRRVWRLVERIASPDDSWIFALGQLRKELLSKLLPSFFEFCIPDQVVGLVRIAVDRVEFFRRAQTEPE